MATLTFDTLEAAEDLQAAGLSAEHAKAVVRVVEEGRKLDLSHLATKHDLELPRRDLKPETGKMLAISVGVLGGVMALFKFVF